MVIVASVTLYLLKLKSPYCIWQNMIMCGVFLEERIFKHLIEQRLSRVNERQWALVAFVIGIILWVCTENNIMGRLQADCINKENPAIVMLIAFAGCLMVYGLSKILDGTLIGRMIAIVGNHSFSIMLLNYLAFKAGNLVYCLVYDLPMSEISKSATIEYKGLGWFFIFVFLGTVLPIVAAIGYEKLKLNVVSSITK